MSQNERQKSLINRGHICPYCGDMTQYVDSIAVYNRSYGMIYLCFPCKAWVGVHNGTNQALGRLANYELRQAKIQAHAYFDGMWKKKMERNKMSKNVARNLAYEWLARMMGLTRDDCHIGMFDVAECNKVVELCKPYYKQVS